MCIGVLADAAVDKNDDDASDDDEVEDDERSVMLRPQPLPSKPLLLLPSLALLVLVSIDTLKLTLLRAPGAPPALLLPPPAAVEATAGGEGRCTVINASSDGLAGDEDSDAPTPVGGDGAGCAASPFARRRCFTADGAPPAPLRRRLLPLALALGVRAGVALANSSSGDGGSMGAAAMAR